MKKFGIIILCIVLGLMLVSCGGEGTNPENETESGVESESESESESAVETEPQGPVETMALEEYDFGPKGETYDEEEPWKNNLEVTYEYNLYDANGATARKYGDKWAVRKLGSGFTAYYEPGEEKGVNMYILKDNGESYYYLYDYRTISSYLYEIEFFGHYSLHRGQLDDKEYVGEEVIAGRNADHYRKDIYVDDELYATSDIWIDKQFDITLSIEEVFYDEEGKPGDKYFFTVKEIKIGELTEEDVIDLEAYGDIEYRGIHD